MSDYLEALVLTTYVVGARYLQLHTADPGDVGLSDVAGNGLNLKRAVTMGAVVGDVTSNTTAPEWGPASASTVITHVTLWDDAVGSNLLYSGALAAPQTVVSGAFFRLPVGALTVTNE